MELPRVDVDHIRDLMKLMDQYDFHEIDLRDDGKRLHLTRGKHAQAHAAVVMPTVMAASPLAAADADAAADGPPANVKVITSPMVGTFYRAPGPDSGPFVEEDQEIGEETVLCIIEAMKVMNEIKAECEGHLVKILVANGEAVEYGEPLFHVRLST
jgi:acetyl-CoA carboxylase biotin carboxyl carrier protein